MKGLLAMSMKKRYRAFTILSVIAICFGGLLTWRASATTVVPAGYDQFSTLGSGETSEQWGALPAGFFINAQGAQSNAINAQTVTFEGRNAVPGFNGDTVIERTQSVSVPGSTALLVAGIRFIAENQVTATFPAGTPVVTYTVLAQESQIAPSTGEMTFNTNGTYTSSLTINRQYTFVPTDPTQPTITVDSTTAKNGGVLIFAPIDLNGGGTWSGSGGSSSAAMPAGAMRTDATTGSTGVTGSTGPTGSTSPTPTPIQSPTPCVINPNSEAGQLAAHGIKPAGCTLPSPTPTPVATATVTASPTATVVP
jgi:hypothetical protein